MAKAQARCCPASLSCLPPFPPCPARSHIPTVQVGVDGGFLETDGTLSQKQNGLYFSHQVHSKSVILSAEVRKQEMMVTTRFWKENFSNKLVYEYCLRKLPYLLHKCRQENSVLWSGWGGTAHLSSSVRANSPVLLGDTQQKLLWILGMLDAAWKKKVRHWLSFISLTSKLSFSTSFRSLDNVLFYVYKMLGTADDWINYILIFLPL